MVIEALNRRSFLAATAIGFALPFAGYHRTHEKNLSLFIGSQKQADDSYSVVAVDECGKVRFQETLPDRGHDTAISPDRKTVVLFARRPGRFAVVMDLRQREQTFAFQAPANRHFYGHGFFTPDGRLLFTSENDFENERGVIGIYSVGNGYIRIGEFETMGIGPHQILLMRDQQTIAVANGGIATHPDFPRQKLNLAGMSPSISYLDLASGKIIDRALLPESFQRLSIRHISEARDRSIWFGGQYEGYSGDEVPLVGRHIRFQEIEFIQTEVSTLREMKHYIGAVTGNNDGSLIAATCPRGGLVLVWDAISLKLIAKYSIPDVCGIAPLDRGFLLSDGLGKLWRNNVQIFKCNSKAWDNHLKRV
jgi:hypothetical protein